MDEDFNVGEYVVLNQGCEYMEGVEKLADARRIAAQHKALDIGPVYIFKVIEAMP